MTSTPDTTRVSDADRERVAGILRDAVGRGQLSLTEFDERLRTAYSALTRADLATVTSDLPHPSTLQPRTVSRPTSRADWRPWLGGALLMVGIWAVTSLAAGHALFFWPAIPLAIWAVSQIATATGVKPAARGCRVPSLPRH